MEKMSDANLPAHTVRSHGTKVAKAHKHDWIILLLLAVIDGGLNFIEPFHRFVGEGMLDDLKFPFKKHDTIPFWGVPIIAVLFPIAIFIAFYFRRRDVYDLHHAILGIFYAVLITGVITDAIKDAVGRPRPNFFYRCFPDGILIFDPRRYGDVLCNGNKAEIKEGYKSFPSGHSSWSFAGLGFLAWYISGKIKAFDRRGHVAKLCIVFLPLIVASLVAISRVDDYWHHWQDVCVGGFLGLTVASFTYLQFFPPPHDSQGWGPHAYFRVFGASGREEVQPSSSSSSSSSLAERKMLDASQGSEDLEDGRRI